MAWRSVTFVDLTGGFSMMDRAAFVLVAGILVAACSSGPAISVSPASLSPTSTTSASPAPASVSTSPSIAPSAAAVAPWIVVALGDSIPYNLAEDCPGCRGFVNQYQLDLQKASGHPVTPRNLSKHTGLRLEGLLDMLAGAPIRASVAQGDVIIVSIAGNDVPMNVDTDPCDGADSWDTLKSSVAAAKKYTTKCVTAWADALRPKLEGMYADIASLRAGKPTVLLTMNGYDDWVGWCEHRACEWNVSKTPTEVVTASRLVHDARDKMQCAAAIKSGFICVDTYHSFNGPKGLDAADDLVANDYTHPSQAGNDRIAELLASEGYDPLWP